MWFVPTNTEIHDAQLGDHVVTPSDRATGQVLVAEYREGRVGVGPQWIGQVEGDRLPAHVRDLLGSAGAPTAIDDAQAVLDALEDIAVVDHE